MRQEAFLFLFLGDTSSEVRFWQTLPDEGSDKRCYLCICVAVH